MIKRLYVRFLLWTLGPALGSIHQRMDSLDMRICDTSASIAFLRDNLPQQSDAPFVADERAPALSGLCVDTLRFG